MDKLIIAENLLIIVISVINCWVILTSYRRGSTAWVEKFGIVRTLEDGRRSVTSGANGELVINAVWAVGYISVLNTGAGFSIFMMNLWHVLLFSAIGFGFFWWAYHFPIGVLARYEDRSESYRRRLRRGYTFYWIFTVNFYLGVFLTASRLVHHYAYDVSSFFSRAADFLARNGDFINQATVLDLSTAAQIERLNVEFLVINRTIIQQLEPVVIFASFVIIVLTLIAYTPLKNSFHANTRKVGYIASAVAVTMVVLSALASYYFQYSGFSETYKDQLFVALQLDSTDLRHIELVSHILERLLPFTGLSGFFKIFTEEGGIFVVGVALTHLGAGIIARDIDENEDDISAEAEKKPDRVA